MSFPRDTAPKHSRADELSVPARPGSRMALPRFKSIHPLPVPSPRMPVFHCNTLSLQTSTVLRALKPFQCRFHVPLPSLLSTPAPLPASQATPSNPTFQSQSRPSNLHSFLAEWQDTSSIAHVLRPQICLQARHSHLPAPVVDRKAAASLLK